jgi:plasmid stabilization system protein ParE
MRNGYRIDWSVEASECLDAIIEYLDTEFGEQALIQFSRKLNKRLDLISISPKIFAKHKKRRSIRRSVLTKEVTIYYKVYKDSVLLLSLFDNRQHPFKAPK